ncbi:hypothetical protein F5B19DRAFT_459371 [Rostrohypoxylon terebratum]|nr:hypothetical protein F5B19DRAFT_459371 [Rostrohypoxylon terebratum]
MMLLFDDISLLIIIAIINTLAAALPIFPTMVFRFRACESTPLLSHPDSILDSLVAYLPPTHVGNQVDIRNHPNEIFR